MMNKTYKTKLKIKSKKDLESFKKMAGVYRYFYNNSLEAQEFNVLYAGLNPEKYFLNGTQLLNVMKVDRKTAPFVKEVDNGIFTAAVFTASNAYLKAFKLQIPKYLSKKKSTLKFKTYGGIKVNYDSIHIPKFGKVKLYEKGYIPQGKKYTDISFSYDGNDWWVSLKVEEKYEKPSELKGDLVIDFDKNGNLLANSKVIGNIINSESYQKELKKFRNISKKYKRQINQNVKYVGSKRVNVTTKNIIKTKKKLSKVSVKLKSIKKDYFRKVACDLARTKPQRIQVLSNVAIRQKRNGYLSRKLRESSTWEFFNILKKKITLIGSCIERYNSLEYSP